MSLSTPILMVGAPCARGRTSGMAAAVAEPRSKRREMVMASIPSRGRQSNAQILMQFIHAGFQPVVRDHVDHLAMFHHVVPIGHRLGEAEVLLHQKHGEPTLLDLPDRAADLL